MPQITSVLASDDRQLWRGCDVLNGRSAATRGDAMDVTGPGFDRCHRPYRRHIAGQD